MIDRGSLINPAIDGCIGIHRKALTLDAMTFLSLPKRVSLDSIKLISHWMLRISILIALLSSDYVISLN